jgi:AcrR family transcriptional regulator
MSKPPTLRKERERAVREELILTHARRLLLSNGFQGLSLDELARSIEYSKGTIYLHFESKEDIALAVTTEALRERSNLFERATRFQGLSRERARAIGFACCHFMVTNPDYFNIDMMMKSQSFWDKASEQRREAYLTQSGRCFRSLQQVVLAAFEAGDLPPGSLPPEHISMAMASVTVGSHIMAEVPGLKMLAGIEDPVMMVRNNQDLLLDGMQWKPLLRDHDYHATDQRIRAEIFPEATWLKPA